ncbi:penicillin-insensitive murein endopeptidase [Shewanella sp. YLB-07]|nr:penicillin-insensitive murein endopeptidase [Shewanella sp. YLB-07]
MKTPYPVTNDQPDGEVLSVTKIGSLAIGSYANGCLAGADALPLEGEGYQVIRTSRNRYYGHPELISFVQEFAKQLNQSEGDGLLIGDISMPRGGTFTSGHASHQIGLDVDIWFRRAAQMQTLARRESPEELDVVNQGAFKLNDNWQEAHAEMIRLAALDPKVARIFVNPVIKQELCRRSLQVSLSGSTKSKEYSWLNKVRPWWGHSFHMHVRLHCPLGDSLCRNQQPPRPGSGCEDIGWWKRQLSGVKQPTDKTKKPEAKHVRVKPEQCAQLLK